MRTRLSFLLVISSAVILPIAAYPANRSYHYNTQGAPDFSSYTAGVTTYDQVVTDLGQPEVGSLVTSARGLAEFAQFDVPIEGTQQSSSAARTAAESAVSSFAHHLLGSIVGRAEARLPGPIGDAVAGTSLETGGS